ncbi:MAG: EAL domain-containing protein [Chloroflexota bacterium]
MATKDIIPEKFYSVVIGFNQFDDSGNFQPLQFAEKDAKDIFDVLVDEKYGNYPYENSILITGKVEQYEIESKLFTHIVSDRDENDTVFVYYSGHGFIAGDSRDAYLATPEITIHHILNNPKSGLSMKWLHDDIFSRSPARYVIFILDCCHSGAFCPSIRGSNVEPTKDLIERGYFVGEGRIAFVSSPKGVSSRERADFKNGVFTHFLLEGLKGGAADPKRNEVTMSSLITFVENHAPNEQPPLHYGQATKIILTRPNVEEIRTRFVKTPISEVVISGKSDKSPLIHPLSNPIEEHISFIDNLIDCGIEEGTNELIGQKILNSVRCVLDADFISLEELKEYHLISKIQSEPKFSNQNVYRIRSNAIKTLQTLLVQPNEILIDGCFGFFESYRSQKSTKYCVVVPLKLEFPRKFLLLAGVPSEKLKHGQILGRALISLYKATNEFTSTSSSMLENVLFDDLKLWFSYVPSGIYFRRKESFIEHLKTINFVFEPIVDLGKVNPRIDSWEALARDPRTNKAPIDLFKAAELWGSKFILELDLYCLRMATSSYVNLWKTERANIDRKDGLSVNVYPDSLYFDEYRNEIRRIILEEEILKPNELVLEISERRAAPKPIENPSHLSVLELFLEKLFDYADEFNISFAIDDFGIGYSSVDRLAQLGLDHIKIDRDVLHHQHPSITIDYVVKMVKKLHPGFTKIIVEGFDGNHRISLAELYNLGIRFVQGHLIRRGSPNLDELDYQVKTFIINELTKPIEIDNEDNR